eukprot:CAMPEP_0183745726 /NCGR_PEP_ID=MMETSP0737-20130205/66390_1 /TAXON_ID=385413 /ORGANISM="Thalassiosira miniscula, Strain CCMP1093" /LENGTH=408 /DNA_ID=CAMNT_0025981405 /DNA_START=510 /DNA_END=1733 /DNA_ORIENTATION=+
MPIYLCQPGASSKEPWRHGVQVYERPFPLHPPAPSSSSTAKAGVDAASATGSSTSDGGDGPRQIVLVANTPAEKFASLHRILSSLTRNDRAVVFCDDTSSSSREEDGAGVAVGCDKLAREWNRREEGAVAAGGSTTGSRVAASLRGNEAATKIPAIWAAFRSGTSNILVVDDGAEQIIQKRLQSSKLAINTIVNYDLRNVDTSRYLSRLHHYTQNHVITFFHSSHDAAKAKELAEILRRYDQPIPKDLAELVPPPLLPPRRDEAGVTGGAAAAGGDEGGRAEGRGRTLRAIPLREDSHSPVPEQHHGDDDAADRDDAANRAVAASGSAAAERRMRRRFLENRNTTVSHSSSSDDDDDDGLRQHHEGGAPSSQRLPPRRAEETTIVRPNPVRRVRHAEVVLVDQCLVAY